MKLHLEENINTPSDEQEKTISKVKRAIDNFAGQITVNSDLEKDVEEFLLKKGISFMKDDSNLSKGKITFKLGYKKLKESYPINAFSDEQSKTFDRLDNILSKFKSLNRKYVPRKSIDGTDKVMLSKSGKDFVNIYKDGSFEILDDNGKVTARVIDIDDFSDNDLGRIFIKELSITESLEDDDKLRKINILYHDAINHGVPSSKLDKILIKNGADPNADTFDVGLKVDSAYEELTNYLRDIYKVKGLSNTPYKSYEILGLEDYFKDESLNESLTKSDKAVILDVVKGKYETGHGYLEGKEDYEEALGRRLTNAKYEQLEEFYNELMDLGPEGFYEEYKDILDFDPDFIEEYGYSEDDEEEEDLTESLLKIGLFS